MSKKADEYLRKIGPRPLSHAEARELYLLRLEDGEKPARAGDTAKLLTKKKKEGGDASEKGGAGKSKFLK